MILKNYYYYFVGALSPKTCDDIIQYGNSQKELLGTTEQYRKQGVDASVLTDNEKKDLKKNRDSNIVFIDKMWAYNLLQPWLARANKDAGWNFQYDFSEAIQFTKYKLNQFYDWHPDSFSQPFNSPQYPNVHGKIRKLSMTVNLSDPNDYEGGDLEFDFRNSSKVPNVFKRCEEARVRGSIIVFPSFVWHRVTPVTKGTRYSMVMWTLGKEFV